MNWILLSLIVAFLYAINNIIDKIFINNYIKNPYLASAISYSATFFLFCGISIFKVNVFDADIRIIFFAFIIGIINSIACILFYFTIQKDEVSRFVLILSFQPAFVIILSFFVLGEFFSNIIYLGLILTLAGSLLISFKKVENKYKINYLLLFLIILTTILFALRSVLIRYVSLDTDIYLINFWIGIAAGLMFIIIYPFHRPKNLAEKKGAKALFIADILSAIILFTLALALKDGPASLVTSLMQVKLVFVFIITLILTKYFPNFLKEEISKKIILQKIMAMSIIIIGTLLIIYR